MTNGVISYIINSVMEMKKILALVLISAVFGIHAYGAYTVDVEENAGYTVDTQNSEIKGYIKHVCTWDTIEAEAIALNTEDIIIHSDSENQTAKLTAEVMPLNASNRDITYSSDNEAVASIDSNGNITAHNTSGSAIITTKSGKISKRCRVRVVKGVTGVTLSQYSLQFYADKPVTAVLTAAVEPEDATIKDVEWQSEDVSIASVDEEGVVTPCGVGKTMITAKTADGGFEASCEVTVDTWEKRTEEPTLFYTDYDIALSELVSTQMNASPTVFNTKSSPASVNDVREYANPQNFTNDFNIYQFLKLSGSNDTDAQTLNNYLVGKGVLEGKGNVFAEAAKKYDVSEIYLAVHACLESGNGMSELARGVEVDGTVVYNLFGIGAYDSDPIGGGSRYAYNQGWTSVDAAITGGAEWISKNYIAEGQDTLYKMRWNPERPGSHQYATDVAWASKQAKTLKNMFGAFPSAKLTFEFPIYKNQQEPDIKFD